MKNKNVIIIAGAVLAFLMALLLTLYPLIANYVNCKYASEIHTSYQETIKQTDNTVLEREKELAMAYNNALVPGTSIDTAYTQEGLQAAAMDYEKLLNINGDGIMGYIQM